MIQHFRPSRLILIAFCLGGVFSSVYGQEIRDQKEAERIYRESLEQSKYNKLYFDEADRCRQLNREQKHQEAILSCRRSIAYAEKLPAGQVLERQAGYIQVGIAFLRQKRPKEALNYFEKGVVIGRSVLGESDVETGEIYFLIGQAHHIDGNTATASEFYDRAERTIRAAYDEMGEDGEELRERYPRIIWHVLEAHLMLLEEADEEEKMTALRKRLHEFELAFQKYLKK